MTNYSKKTIQKLAYKYIILRKGGFVGGISGRVNSGKSIYGNKIILNWMEEVMEIELKNKTASEILDSYLVYEVEDIFNKTFQNLEINGKVFTKEDFAQIPQDQVKDWCSKNISTIKVKPGRCLLVDEAGAAISNREFWSVDNRAMGKLVQVWRFLRMFVIFIVPERMELLEKTLREFFDFRIEMKGINREGNYAKAVIYERTGRNFKGEPMFTTARGCRYRGFIRVRNLEEIRPDVVEEYERRSNIFKTSIMLQARFDVLESNGTTPRERKDNRAKDINRYITEAKQCRKELTDTNKITKKEKISLDRIQNKFGVGIGIARRIRVELENDNNS